MEQMARIEEARQLSKKSFEDAQALFKQSIESTPGAESTFGRNVLESLIGIVSASCSRS